MYALTPGNPISVASGGSASFSANINIPNNASAGAYNIQITTQDTTGAPSHSATIPLTVAQDFLVTSTTPGQTVNAGQTTGPYQLSIKPVGSSFNAAVTLSCTAGLPAGAQCNFSPSTPVTPGNSAVDVVMSISTTASHADTQWRSGVRSISYSYIAGVLIPGLVLGFGASHRMPTRRLRPLSAIGAFLLLTLLMSCAGASTGGGGGPPPPNPKTYHVTVTGTSVGTPPDAGQSVVVTLVVN